ncbi:MAG: S41 family peptidase [Clostridiales bacterium]|nr:MAG: S41 family peptidase [Clostridiales bacterium]PWL50718.1 MAG: S41 family peptidase [Clostridiales bacterium]
MVMKNRKLSLTAVLLIVFFACLVTFMTTFVLLRSSYEAKLGGDIVSAGGESESGIDFDKLLEVDAYVRANFIGTVDYEKAMQYMLDGYMYALGDKYSVYHTAEEMQELTNESNGDLVGIGVRVMMDDETGGIRILNVMHDSPALEAGLQVGDVIVKVGDLEVTADTYNTAVNDVAGEAGTELTVTILRNGETFERTLTRRLVRSEAVFLEMQDNHTALIRIYEFTGNAADDFIAAMEEAQKAGATGYVFDVRNNPGGDLGVIVRILDYLLPEGPIVRIIDASGEVVHTYTSDESEIQAPMVVLINENTASAAELFTSALLDYDKCVTVGQTTYGKGVMQNIITLPDGSGIRLTTHYYNPPYSDNYNGVGIPADYELEMASSAIADPALDTQLQKALSLLAGSEGSN